MKATKQEYKVTHQEAWASAFLLYVVFQYNGEQYTAQSQYINGGWGLDGIEVYDDERQEVCDEGIVAIGEKLIYELEINDKTITY